MSPKERVMRQSLYLRLRPFLRRDLRARLVCALLTVFVLTGLSWLGVSAMSKIDSREAHHLRVELGLEHAWAVCDGPYSSACTYDDREQTRVDAKFAHERKLRLAVLDELSQRVGVGLAALDQAEAIAKAANTSPRTGAVLGDTVALREALEQSVVDLRPAPLPSIELRRDRLLWPLEVEDEHQPARCSRLEFDGIGWVDCAPEQAGAVYDSRYPAPADMRKRVLEQIAIERGTLVQLRGQLDRLIAREGTTNPDATSHRADLVAELSPLDVTGFEHKVNVAGWLTVRPPSTAFDGWDLDTIESSMLDTVAASGLPTVSTALATLARHQPDEVSGVIDDLTAEVWHGAWTHHSDDYPAIVKPSERYRSPIAAAARWQLLGTALFLLAGVMLVLVGPVVTATTTAREREAGTLPVLRMTGLSAGDLALAMAIGPNVFAAVAGAGLLAVAIPILALTIGLGPVLVPLAIVVVLTAAMHLTAIGLGDALGQRVNALIVGGLLGAAVLLPGLVGTVMVVGDMAATGFLLGPLPLTLTSIVGLSGLPFAEHAAAGASGEMGSTIMGYALGAQALLGGLCLLSWRRRVEQAWAPLFRPLEGAVLAIASVGCSALAVLDLSERINVQTYDAVNLITFVATAFLMPILGWLLVSSLVRPARAAAVASVQEVRRAFGRFQLFLVLTAGALAGAYVLVLERTGLAAEDSEIMWATITQGVLIAQTIVATLLWTSRKRDGRHRVLILGAIVVLMQIAFTVGVYNLEVEHVALTQASAMPLLLGMDASPYWLAFLVVLWAAGLGLILAALLRERDRAKADRADADLEDELDEEDEDGRSKWLH
jgi:hypothetical protein